jgi:aspartyl-tRNA(Asn)/glutamyl-tRNA(Gln) amidotransferase subunit B
VDEVIIENIKQVGQYREGKVQVLGFLVGQCMKKAQGQGNAQLFSQLLEVSLNQV